MFTLSGASSTTSYLYILHLSILDYYIVSIFHHLGSPLSYRMLIVDVMRNLYLYNADIIFDGNSNFIVFLLVCSCLKYGVPVHIHSSNYLSQQKDAVFLAHFHCHHLSALARKMKGQGNFPNVRERCDRTGGRVREGAGPLPE